MDALPDVRDGLTRLERVVLTVLHRTQRERGGRNVPTAMLYGRVCEHSPISVAELQRTLQRLIGGPAGAAVDPARVRRPGDPARGRALARSAATVGADPSEDGGNDGDGDDGDNGDDDLGDTG